MKRQRRTIVLCILCIGVVLAVFSIEGIGQVVAQGASEINPDEETVVGQIQELANMIIRLLSRGWIVLAFLAGKVLTNDFVYGAPLGFDQILWQLWQVMRSFANFTLGFLFVFYILRNFLGRIDTTQLKQKVLGIVSAAILVQASWFILAALIDLSTIGIAAVSSVPMSIMQNRWPKLQENFPIEKKIYVKDLLEPDLLAAQESIDNQTGRTLEQLLPQADSVSGPLLFLGASVISATKFNVAASDNIKSAGGVASIIILKALGLILFTIPLLGLFIVGMMRIFYIWIWAIISPFIIIDYLVLNEVLANKAELKKYFNVKDLVSLIFQPVLMVGVIVLALLFVIGMASLLVGNEEKYEEDEVNKVLQFEVITNQNMAKVGPNDIAPMYVKGSLLESTQQFVGGFIGQSILLIFTIFMLWTILKLSMKGGAIVGDVLSKLSQTTESLIKAMPIPGVGVGVGALDAAKDRGLESMNRVAYGNRASKEQAEIQKYFNKITGNNDVSDINNRNEKSLNDLQTPNVGTATVKNMFENYAQEFMRIRAGMKPDVKLQYNNSPLFKKSINTLLNNATLQAAKDAGLLPSSLDVTKGPSELVKDKHVTALLESIVNGKVITRATASTARESFDTMKFAGTGT